MSYWCRPHITDLDRISRLRYGGKPSQSQVFCNVTVMFGSFVERMEEKKEKRVRISDEAWRSGLMEVTMSCSYTRPTPPAIHVLYTHS